MTNSVITPEYETPRLEPASAFRGPHARGTTGTLDSWNIVCNDCASGGGA